MNNDMIEIGELKGIKIFIEDDLHDLGLLISKLYRENDKKENRREISNTYSTTKITIYGLAKKLAELENYINPRYDFVFSKITKYGLPERATVEIDL